MTVKSSVRAGLVAGSGLAAMLGASVATAAEFDLKVAHVAGANTPVQVCLEVMEGYVQRISGDRIDFQIYPAG